MSSPGQAKPATLPASDPLNAVLQQMDQDKFLQSHPTPTMRGPADGANAPAPSSPANNGPSLAGTIGQDALGIGAGALRAPGQAVGGLLDFGADVGRFIGQSALPIVRRYPAVAKAIVDTNNAFNGSAIGQAYNRYFNPNLDGHTDFADRLSAKESLGQVGATNWNQGAAEMLSLAVGYGGAAKAASTVGVRALGHAAIDAAKSPAAKFATKLALHSAGIGAAAGVFMDPEEERLSNGLQALGVHNEFIDWLGNHDPSKERTFEDRFKTAIDTAMGNVPAELMFDTAKYWVKTIKTGRADKAAAQAIQERIASVAKQAAGHPDFNPEAPPLKPTEATPEQAAKQNLDDAFATVRTRMLMGGQPVPRTFFGLAGDEAAALPGGDVSPELQSRVAAVADTAPPSAPVSTSDVAPIPSSGKPVFGQRQPLTPELADRIHSVTGVQPDTPEPVTLTQGEAAKPFGKRPAAEPGALPRTEEALANPDGGDGSNGSFKTNPAALATEHADQVDSLTAQGTGAAVQPKGGQLPNDISIEEIRRQIAKDANVALQHGGAPDKLDAANLPLQPDGKLAISPDGKAAMDGAGYGKAFVSNADTPPPGDTVLLAGAKPLPQSKLSKVLDLAGAFIRHTGGEVKVFGTASKEDLIKFNQDASEWRARVKNNPRMADITAADGAGAARVGEWRLGNLGAQDDVPGLLRALTDRLAQDPKPVPDRVVQAAAHRAANEIGEDPTALLELSRQIAGRLGSADRAMATLRTVWTRTAKDLDQLGIGSAGKDWTNASDAEVNQALHKIYDMMALSSHVQEAKAGLGRGLRVNKLPDADAYLGAFAEDAHGTMPPRGGDVRSTGPLPRNRQELQDWSELWGMTKGDPQTRAKFLEGQLTLPAGSKYLRTSFANFFTAAILSAPRTVLLNLVGPSMISVYRTLEKTSGAALLSLNPLATAAERATQRTIATQTASAYFQTFGDIGDAIGQAWRAAESNRPILGGGGSNIDLRGTYGPLTENLIAAAGQEPSWTYSLGNMINVFPRAFARVNNGLDELAKRLSYMGEVRVRALTDGVQQGLSGQQLRDFVQQRLEASTDEAGHATDDYMERLAERTTFTASVGEEGSNVRQFGNFIQRLRSDVPEFRYILPVFNVPANSLGETLRRLPIAYLPITRGLFAETGAELAGERGPVAQAEAHGRMMLGSAFLLGGVMLNRSGLLTGAGPQQPTDRKVWLATHQPYSIRVGDKWVRYDKFDILGGLLSIPATIVDATTNQPGSEKVNDMLWSGVGALAQWFKDRASLRTAAGLFSLGADPTQNTGNFASQFAGQTISGFVPAALRTTMVDTTDPYLRLKHGWTDYLKATLPGLSNSLEPVRNVLGEPVNRPQNSIPEAVLPITMAPAVSYKDDPVLDELDRLYQTTGYGAGADPRSLSYGSFDPKQVKLENGRSMFDQAVGDRQAIEINGKTLRQALTELFNSDKYNRAVDADPMQSRTSLGDVSRGYLVKQLFEKYEGAIKAKLANESPLALAYLTAAAAKQKDDAYLSKYSADDLVKNPLLYQSAGVDAGRYARKLQGSGALLQTLEGR